MSGKIVNSLWGKWKAYQATPFAVLVRLFMNRILHGNNGGEDELNLSMGLVLTLLAIPGGFISLFLFDKYGSLLRYLRNQPPLDTLSAAMPDEYFFIVLSMTVTGAVALWWWDGIFPDRRDFANLVPLPIATSRIFLANALALGLLACLFTMDVNAASSILFPAVVGAAQPSLDFVVHFGAVHSLVVMLASIFSFFSVFALVGLLLLILPYGVFRRVSLYFRGLIVIVLLTAMATSFAVPHLLAYPAQPAHLLLRYLPPIWFLELCQMLRGRADPTLAQLGRFAPVAVVSVFLIAVAAYALSYRRCFMRLPELASAPPGKLGTRTIWIFHWLDGALLRTPVQRAGYRFVMKTLLRNEAHALALGGFAALGVVIASEALVTAFDGKGLRALPSPELLSIPLALSYCLLMGIRLIFDIPASLPSNWTFRFLLDKDASSAALARRVMLSFVWPWLFGIALPVYLYFWGWHVALLHIVVVAAWSALLAEILLLRFRKIPFTCSYPSFRHSAVVAIIIYVLGFVVFAGMTSEFEADVLRNPWEGILLLLIGGAVWGIIYRIRNNLVEIDKQVIFEDVPDTGFEFLHLMDGA